MALGVVKITDKDRKKLLIILFITNIIQIAFGLVLFLEGIHVTLAFGTKLHALDKAQLGKIFKTVAIFGFLIMFMHAVGLKVCYNCAHPQRHIKPGRKLAIWFLAGLSSSIVGIFLAYFAPISATTLLQQLKNSLYRGMGQYLNDPAWKRTIDQLQQSMECCGTLNYTDWYHISWINIDLLREDSQTVLHYTEDDGRVLPPVVPWSCCKPSVNSPCFHDMLQQLRSVKVWQEHSKVILDSLYKVGCLEVLKSPIISGLQATAGICVCIFIFQISTGVFARYLYTASRNSILLGDCAVTSYGWLFGRGDFGYKGPTMEKLNEIAVEQKLNVEKEQNRKKDKINEDKKKTKMEYNAKDKSKHEVEISNEESQDTTNETTKLLSDKKW